MQLPVADETTMSNPPTDVEQVLDSEIKCELTDKSPFEVR